uniref:SFRICE_002634 n=1 Tax=Spodoptera frugiperda TaxID=7108 RepID=A0A2H1V709_SPOFR
MSKLTDKAAEKTKPVNGHTDHLMVSYRRCTWTLETPAALQVHCLFGVRNLRFVGESKIGKIGKRAIVTVFYEPVCYLNGVKIYKIRKVDAKNCI